MEWSDFEDALVAGLYPDDEQRTHLFRSLPHRTRDAVRVRAIRLGASSKPQFRWKEQDLQKAAEMYRRGFAYKEISRLIGFSPKSIMSALLARRKSLGIEIRRRRWSANEIRILGAEWGEVSSRTLRSKLPKRTWAAIYNQARSMGLSMKPQGYERVSDLARRAGYSRDQMVSILKMYEVKTKFSYSEKKSGKGRLYAQPDDALEAASKYSKLDSIADVMRRYVTNHRTVYGIALRAGLITSTNACVRKHRLDPDEIDKLMSLHGIKRRET